jgi:hypothetical protein
VVVEFAGAATSRDLVPPTCGAPTSAKLIQVLDPVPVTEDIDELDVASAVGSFPDSNPSNQALACGQARRTCPCPCTDAVKVDGAYGTVSGVNITAGERVEALPAASTATTCAL